MEEADQLCQRVAFLNEGRIVALDTPQNLKIAHGRRRAKVRLKGAELTQLTLSLDDPADARHLSDYVAQGQVLTIHSEEATLEDIFIKLAGRRLM
jgi:ABC-2 type transport system ATP-binding protein